MGKSKTGDIVEAIFNVLPVQRGATVAEIATSAGIAWQTADKYLKLIIDIQGQPPVLQVKLGEKVGYRRQTQAGRPKKT